MKFHNARVGRRSKYLLTSTPNIVRGLTIDNKMQHIHGNKRNECTQNKLVLLFSMKKRGSNLKRIVIGSSQVGGGTQQRIINKLENTLSKQIRLHLHSSINVIGIHELQGDNMLSVRKRNNCCKWRV